MKYKIIDKDTKEDIRFYKGLTWDAQNIDEAYRAIKKLFPNAIIVKVEN